MTGSTIGTVLVTGGAGFIGSALSHLMASSAERWVVLDNLHPQVHPSGERPPSLHPAAELVIGDVSDPSVWTGLLADFRPEFVVHLAAETGTAQSLHEASRHAEVNVLGTTRMLDAFATAGHVPSHFILSSSRAVYGEGVWLREDGTSFLPGQRSHAQFERGEWDFPGAVAQASEATRTWPAPTSVYGATKLAQEHLLHAWTGSHDSQLTVLRFQNVYGPGQSLINPYTGIVSLFSRMAMRGESIPIYEDGAIVRDFVYIDDIAASLGAVIERRPTVHPAIFDIGSGVGTTILELAQHIAAFHHAPPPHVTGAYRDGDVRFAECDISRSVTNIDWTPKWDVEQGVARLQEWIASQP
ncbi:NAD-dependent epimerase/dehydratase family protein [Glaciihabitans sp. INWT7]|uniref:NAD-dependent epimerase/dehydratase family protein n=1 Tax=Glaciihabitans sp. INWT7 TaxID=2596912 RepID=UPI00351C0CAB